MSDYLTIKETAELMGVSERTIRRNVIAQKDVLNKVSKVKVVSNVNGKTLVRKSFVLSLTSEINVSQNTSVLSDNVKTNENERFVDYIEKEVEILREQVKK